MLLCEHCIETMKSKGAIVVYNLCDYIEEEEAEEMELKCELCYEVDTLYTCKIYND